MSGDYYIVLGVSRGADLARIKRAYRKIAKKYHPDMSRTEETAPRFIEAREAFETLADADKRRQYDLELASEGAGDRIRRVPDIVGAHRKFYHDTMESFLSDSDAFFSGFVRGLFDVERGRKKGKDLYFEAVLSPAEAFEGGLCPVTVPVLARCPRCAGTGYWEEFYCRACRGYGRVRTDREFSLSIPAHVRDGTEITLSLEDIGLRDALLHVVVTIDPDLG